MLSQFRHLIFQIISTVLLVFLGHNAAHSSHILGGELGWICQGNGTYVFELIIYRDCNGIDVSVTNETIKVWNHPTVNEISVAFISRTDLSPICQQVVSGPPPFQCGSGSGGGNGSGAVERVLYRSNPITLPGNPSASGWIFTYSSFFRSSNLTNIASPNTVGITIVAKMFNTGANGVCNDSSPRFYESPFVVTCVNSPYTFNPNAYDPDLDLLNFEFAPPLDQIQNNYNPPNDPAILAFNPGFSYDSPTPNASMAAGSIPAALNSQNGTLTFNATIPGNFAIRTVVRAFRNGQVISENQLEYQVAVENCIFLNSPPAITPPLNNNTSFETSVTAGELVTFNLAAFENELLQNGTAQSAFIFASGAQFANVITDANSGCANPPCATLNALTPVSGSPNAQINFSWQTACSHLIGANGQTQQSVPYTLVFRVQDNFCQIPAVQYATVTVNVQNLTMPTPPVLQCVTVDGNGDVLLTWQPSSDPGSTFVAYEIHTLQNGLVASINNINTTSFLDVSGNALNQSLSYFILARGGCDGAFVVSSDTLSTIHLDVVNPNTGMALLTWTSIPNAPGMGNFAYIEMEYPTGVWNTVDSVQIGTTNLTHEITICEAHLNFRIRAENNLCSFYSNFDGDLFQDQTPPPIPIIQSVSIDTLSGNLIITWNVSPSPDTYGYIIYDQNNLGFYVELDTVWGINNNSYTILDFDPNSVLSFTVAAFDSCFTDQNPPTYQTSGKANIHSTMYLTEELDICAERLLLSWTPYLGWDDGVAFYRVFVKADGEPWTLIQSTNLTSTSISLQAGQVYEVVVQAVSELGFYSFSNRVIASFEIPGAPDIHYLATASVDWDGLLIKYFSSYTPGQGTVILQKLNPVFNQFEDLEQRLVMNSTEIFIDQNHEADKRRETYRILAIDSCGNPTIHTNIGKTILLHTIPNHAALTVQLAWSSYEAFRAPIVNYRVYRSVNGILDPNPLAILPHHTRAYVDSLSEFLSTSGQFCYFVEAVEGYNDYGFFEVSRSNYSCATIEPLIYIPNTIIINGVNELFLPVLGYFQLTSYDLTILDRWGQTIFRTNNPNEGWNGSVDGKFVPEGTYVYILRINDGENTEITRRGHVNVLIGKK
jgi:gliding motility-associated-like protein